ncbi:hypothetical protein [Streptomyces olivaceiscleroticus]|uniref:PPE family domain-containing protein n=1 Tax=Streptomyces olivaceiscleroticus TaxID=68245 RepID=A0ABN0ZV79_9ACTN
MGKHAKGHGGRTNFENHELDEMIDMVESADANAIGDVAVMLGPVSLQIMNAGQDMIAHLGSVEWEGEAANAFRDWAEDLAKNTTKLGEFASSVANEMQYVAEGLATVKASMPSRAEGKGTEVDKILTPARVMTNPGYVKAKAADDAKHEAARTEAVREMTKLGSYYSVSSEQLEKKSQDAPVFRPPKDGLGVPKPPVNDEFNPGGGEGNTGVPRPVVGDVGGSASPHHSHAAAIPDRQVGTGLDSVAPPKAPEAEPSVPPTTPPSNGPSSPHVPTGPLPTGPLGPGASRSPVSKQQTPRLPGGRVNPTGPNGPLGRTSPPAPARPGSPGRLPGELGIPRTGTTGPSRGGRPDGIVGGTPTRSGGRALSGLPRGTVIGGEHGASGPGTAGGTGGVANRRLASNPGGAVGAPRGVNGSTPSKDFTPGGTGLVRGGNGPRNVGGSSPTPRTPSARREGERDGSVRPDYLAEDRETWTARRRDIVPPVID